MAKKAGKSRGKFVVLVYCKESAIVERTLDGGVGGVKDRYAAGRLLAWWLTDNGHTDRRTATALAYRAEQGGEDVEMKLAGRTLRFTITEQ